MYSNNIIVIWQVVQCFSENGMGIIIGEGGKCFVQLGKGIHLNNDVQDRASFIHFYSETTVYQQFLDIDFFFRQPLQPWRRPFRKAQKWSVWIKTDARERSLKGFTAL